MLPGLGWSCCEGGLQAPARLPELAADILVGVGLGCLLHIVRNHAAEVKVSRPSSGQLSMIAEYLENILHGGWGFPASRQSN